VGILAVDPSSPFTGGAILGDRIRMQDHATDPGVFIRSLATRGNLGGLSRSTADVVAVLDAMGKDVVIVETVGVGQDEIEVAALAHSVVVVAVPGLGDDVQAIKAGVLEIADVFAVNKADREGADRTVRDLQSMLELRRSTATRPMSAEDLAHHPSLAAGLAPTAPLPERIERDAGWEPPIVKTVAVRNEGIGELAEALAAHRAHLEETGGLAVRDVARARAGFLAVLKEQLLDAALARLAAEQGSLDEIAARIAAREADPYGVAEEIAARLRDG
jgi:LAO/AO transport system kinase